MKIYGARIAEQEQQNRVEKITQARSTNQNDAVNVALLNKAETARLPYLLQPDIIK